MTGSLNGGPFPHVESIADPRRIDANASSPDSSSGMSIENLPEEWQLQLRNLQEWICELLIRNQQLRMALMQATSEPRNVGSHDRLW